MKIVIAGAGIGGLTFAAKAKAGEHEIVVYETAPSEEAMRYEWHDDVSPEAFRRAGFDIPEGSFPKKDWTFVAPDGATVRRIYEDPSRADISVWRRKLNEELIRRAKSNARIVFGRRAESLVVENGRVAGIVADGEKIHADLVIDSTGADSVLKRDINVTRHEPDEIFEVYRAFYRKDPAAPEAEYTNKVYLKQMGESGIAWAIQDGDTVDVLIGRVGEMGEETLSRALRRIKEENPTVGDEIVMGGGIYRIPVRYPATRMVADGYAAIGDAAYMTIPMLGSGIASSMAAAETLVNVVYSALAEGKSAREAASKENLWKYEVAFYRETGAEHAGVDVMKRGVLDMPDDIVTWLLGSDILTNEEVCRLAKGKPIILGAADSLKKAAVAGIGKLPVLLKVNSMLMRVSKAIRTARRIPENYSEEAVARWERKLVRAVTGK